MKNPAEYLAAHVFEARRPRHELQSVVSYTDAVQAIEAALADAEKYRYLLMRALRRSAGDPKPVAPVESFLSEQDTPVRPMYPVSDRLAA